MERYSTFLYGATFWSIGFAAAGKNVLLADPSINPGHEFADVFCDHVCSVERLQTEVARSFFRMLSAHGAVCRNRLHAPALVPLLCRFLQENNISVLLDTVMLGKRSLAGPGEGYAVSLMAGSVKWKIHAGHIRNTLVACRRILWKEYRAMLHGENGVKIPAEYRNPPADAGTKKPWITSGRFASEAVLHFPVDANADFPEARERMEIFWKQRPALLKDWKIAAMAQEFWAEPGWGRNGHPGCFSQGYGDPLSALDAGAREAMR